jgi:hypothetical protein
MENYNKAKLARGWRALASVGGLKGLALAILVDRKVLWRSGVSLQYRPDKT